MFKDEADARARSSSAIALTTRRMSRSVRRKPTCSSRSCNRPGIAPLLKTEKSPFRTHFGGTPTTSKDTASWPLRPPAVHAKSFIDGLW